MKISGAEEEKGSLNICIYMLEGIVNYWYLSLLLARVLLLLLWPGHCYYCYSQGIIIIVKARVLLLLL